MLTAQQYAEFKRNKDLWPDGPWKSEPDDLEFEYKGYKCWITRNMDVGGHLLGYVLLPTEHKYHGVGYDDIPLDVHGGLTYSDSAQDGLWQIGFDCAHYNDFMPLIGVIDKMVFGEHSKLKIRQGEAYRDIEFVKKEVINMVDQLEELK